MGFSLLFYLLSFILFAVAYNIETKSITVIRERNAKSRMKGQLYGMAAGAFLLAAVNHYIKIYGCIEGLEMMGCK